MDSQNKGRNILRSILSGIGVAVLFLLIGTVLDYIVTQTLSQFFVTDCSEDCYFKIFSGTTFI
jgi:galactitol-specific phosphotransferase system IIC component